MPEFKILNPKYKSAYKDNLYGFYDGTPVFRSNDYKPNEIICTNLVNNMSVTLLITDIKD